LSNPNIRQPQHRLVRLLVYTLVGSHKQNASFTIHTDLIYIQYIHMGIAILAQTGIKVETYRGRL